MEFEWDKEKAVANFRKHGVSFEEAELAFQDENAVELFDELNSEEENRYQIIAPFADSLAFCRIYNPRRKDSHYLGKKSRCETGEDLQ